MTNGSTNGSTWKVTCFPCDPGPKVKTGGTKGITGPSPGPPIHHDDDHKGDSLEDCINWARVHLQREHNEINPTNTEILERDHFVWSINRVKPLKALADEYTKIPGAPVTITVGLTL